jgi:hypothetical protein
MTVTISGFGLLILLLALTAPEVLLFPFVAVWVVWDLTTSTVGAFWDLAVSVVKAIFGGGGAGGEGGGGGANGGGEK